MFSLFPSNFHEFCSNICFFRHCSLPFPLRSVRGLFAPGAAWRKEPMGRGLLAASCSPQKSHLFSKFWQIDLIKICLTRFSSAIWINLKRHRVTTFIHFCRFFCSTLAKQGRNKCLQIFLFALTLFFLSLLPHLDVGKLWTMFANIEIEYIMSELGLISLLGLPLFTLVPTHLLRSLFRLHSSFVIFPGYFLSFLTVVCFFLFSDVAWYAARLIDRDRKALEPSK